MESRAHKTSQMYPASMRLNRLSFALLLPALEIAVWLILVPTQTGLTYWRLSHGLPASALRDDLPFHGERLIFVLPGVATGAASPAPPAPSHPLFDLALFRSTYPYGMLMTAINMPGMLGEILVSLPTSWPDSWHPEALMLMSWRAIVMPFYCLPFWWFAGVGLDTACGSKTLRWGWLLLGAILFLLFAIVLIASIVSVTTDPPREDGGLLLSGAAFWTIAFSTFPIAWILQRKRTTSATLPTPSA